MAILLLIISVIVIGSKVVYKDDFAIIDGTITLVPNGTESRGQTYINYPTGYNKDNCIIDSIMTRKTDSVESVGFSYGTLAYGNNVVAMSSASMGRAAILRENDITIILSYDWGTVPTHNYDYEYKIILRKIS